MTPTSARWSAGPMPESISIRGEPIAPEERMTSAAAVIRLPSISSTPVARPFSTTMRFTCAPVRTVRFGRSRFGAR